MKIYTSIQKLKMDPKGYLFILWFLLRQKTGCFISTRITYIICRLKGVNIGKKNIFKGITYFERLPNSKISIGNNCQFYSSFNSNSIGVLQRCRIATLTQNSEIIIGDNVGMTGVNIGAAQSIIIGDKTLIGGNSIITDTDWQSLEIDYRHCGIEKAISTPTIIGKNVFIGTWSIILKGSKIGDNTIIGAGSVVAGEIPCNVIAAGNPCKIIKKLDL